MLQPGQTLLGTYRIDRLIGTSGRMGQVYLAEDTSLGLTVAVKVPSLNILLAPRGPERFMREARVAAQLGPHPSIVNIRACLRDSALTVPREDFSASISVPFIVMDFLPGGDLSTRIADGALPTEAALAVFQQVAAAVHFAHTHRYREGGREVAGLVHRDLKPANICFDAQGRPVVVDFGLARLLEGAESSLQSVGTPLYMAPEQWMPSRGIDARADEYSLAIILFEMLTGEPPFHSSSIEGLVQQHLTAPPPNARAIHPGVSTVVADALRIAMSKDPGQRFPTVLDFSRAVSGQAPTVDPTRVRRGESRSAAELRYGGDALARKERFAEAIIEYEAALRLNRHDVLSIINRGFCHFSLNEHEAAIADYTLALLLDPSHPEGLNNRGMAFLAMGQVEAAIRDFQAAIDVCPSHPLAPTNLREAIARRRHDHL